MITKNRIANFLNKILYKVNLSKDFLYSNEEYLYEKDEKIWSDLSYTHTDLRLRTRKAFFWMKKLMNNKKNLKEIESNYLNMLCTTYLSSADPYLKKMAYIEAKKISSILIKDNFFADFEEDKDYYSLMEYLTLFNHLDISIPKLKEQTFKILEEEKISVIERINKEKISVLDEYELYDTMLLTFNFTCFKNQYPNDGIDDLPDLADFLLILGNYKYHLEDKEIPDCSKLSEEDISHINADLYNITHFIFVMCDYCSYEVPREYFMRELNYILKFRQVTYLELGKDPDLRCEIAYILTLMGYPIDDSFIKKCWLEILSSQEDDGSWKVDDIELEACRGDKLYTVFHATWVPYEMITQQIKHGTAPFYKPLLIPLENYSNKA